MGKLISLEGINKAGKTTQVKLLRDRLSTLGLSVVTFKFPSNETPIGNLIYNVLQGEVTIPKLALFALFSVHRLECKPSICEALANSDFVICDRYSESEYTYAVEGGLPLEWTLIIESLVPQALIVFLLDIEPSIAAKRDTPFSTDMFEQDLVFLNRVRRRYLELASNPPRPGQNWRVIDATKPVDEITNEIFQVLYFS